ncbi:MAG: cell division protein ZapA [Lachnospiraceae bacterium]|nr:cell division protein ZapA [Lachnospiraceae bacterium]
MSAKTDTEVIIGGKVLTVSGNESAEYLQKVASYINNKVNEYTKMDSFKRQSADKQNMLIQLNIADDFFKAKKQIELLEQDLKAKENELYDLKHELIATQIKLDNTSKSLKEANETINENSKQIVRLETELKEYQKNEQGG